MLDFSDPRTENEFKANLLFSNMINDARITIRESGIDWSAVSSDTLRRMNDVIYALQQAVNNSNKTLEALEVTQ